MESSRLSKTDNLKFDEVIVNYLRNIYPDAIPQTGSPRGVKLRRILDSLDMLEFISFLEETFSIQVGEQDVLAKNFDTLDCVIAFVQKQYLPAISDEEVIQENLNSRGQPMGGK